MFSSEVLAGGVELELSMGTIAVEVVDDDARDVPTVEAAASLLLLPNANPPILLLLLLVVPTPPIILAVIEVALSAVSNLANRLLGVVEVDFLEDVDVLAPPPKLNPPLIPLPDPPVEEDAADDNPEANDKALDADLDDVVADDDVPKEDAKPENGREDDVVLSVLVLVASLPLDLPVEGSAVMKDEPNIFAV